MRTLFVCTPCALSGMGLEVCFTAALDNWRKWKQGEKIEKLEGYSSPLYAPLYGLAPAVYQLGQVCGIQEYPWPSRGFFYAEWIYVVEFAAMAFYDLALDIRPSKANYLTSPSNICGYIRLDFLPAWMVAGLFFEWLIPQLLPS